MALTVLYVPSSGLDCLICAEQAWHAVARATRRAVLLHTELLAAKGASLSLSLSPSLPLSPSLADGVDEV